MIIGIPIYNDVDLFDVTGAHEVFKWIPDPAIEVRLIATNVEQPIVTLDGFRFLATHDFQQVAALDVIWVPGGAPRALAPMMSGTVGHDYMSFLPASVRGRNGFVRYARAPCFPPLRDCSTAMRRQRIGTSSLVLGSLRK